MAHRDTDRVWLGRLYALLRATCDPEDVASFNTALSYRNSEVQELRFSVMSRLKDLLYRALAVAELNAPASVQGSFIAAGNAFDALTAVGRVLQQAKQDILVIDPYMDEKFLTDFATMLPDPVVMRVLADQASVKPSLKPAVTRWQSQNPSTRPLEARLAPAKALHDRLMILDGADAWSLTQSFNALAARSPASIVKSDPEVAALKVAAYEAIWQAAEPI